MIKHIKIFKIYYWFTRYIEFDLYWRIGSQKKELVLTIWFMKKLTYIKGYEDEWGSSWWTFINILEFETK